MRSLMWVVFAMLCSTVALGRDSDSAIGNETATADEVQAKDPAEAETTDAAKEPEPFVPPAGYRVRTRGDKVMYCKKSLESGTRFSSERCYTEEQLKAIERDSEQEQANLDQAKKICATVQGCGGG